MTEKDITLEEWFQEEKDKQEEIKKQRISIECNRCSYEKNYHSQVIFGCKTCGDDRGYCLACSVKYYL